MDIQQYSIASINRTLTTRDESPQTLRGDSPTGMGNMQESPYERSMYFPSSPNERGSDRYKNGIRGSKHRSHNSYSTRSQHMPGQHEIEVVDLTMDSENDEEVEMRKVIRIDDDDDDVGEREELFPSDNELLVLTSRSAFNTRRTSAAGTNATWTPACDYGDHKYPSSKHANSRIDNLIHPQPLQTLGTRTHLGSKSRLTSPAQSSQFIRINEKLWDRLDIVQPIDRKKAIRRTEYNPNTIASHVLRATGGVPDPAHPGILNDHLWSLRSAFQAVDDTSDLATFRWDFLESDEDMPPALPYEAQRHAHQNIPVRPPIRPTQGGPSHLGGLVDPRPSDFQRPQGAGGGPSYGGFAPTRPEYAVSAAPRPTGDYYQTPYNEGIYGQSSYRSPISHYPPPFGHSSRPQNQTYSGPYSLPAPPSNGYRLPQPALSRPGPGQSSRDAYAHFPLDRINLPPLQLPDSNQTSSNSSVRDSSEGVSNHPSPAQLGEITGRPSQIPPPLHQSVITGRLSQYASTPERSSSPTQSLQAPKSSASKTKSGKPPTALFRFSKEQRATLEREATSNMYPDSSVKRRLAEELGVDLKKVTQFFQNCQAGNYSFAKKIKLAQQTASGNNTDDESRSVMSIDAQPATRVQHSSSPVPTATTPRGRLPGSRVSSGLAIIIDAANDKPVQSPVPVKRLGRPPATTSSASHSPAPSAVKKKGRPFATAESAARAAEKAARRAAGIQEPRKKPGRPAKYLGQSYIKVPEPKFYPFLCEWKNCLAELHNLETLQSHIKFAHRKRNKDNMLECRWAKCCEASEVMGEEVLKGREFENKYKWAKHIQAVHILPIAWRMGDGPKGTDLSLSKPATLPFWLKDSGGKVVTPSVVSQVLEGGKARKNNKKRFKTQGEGLQVVLVPVTNPEAYLKVPVEDEDNEPTSESDSTDGDEMEVDRPPKESMVMGSRHDV